MAQTVEGAAKAVAKILERDPEHFKRIGKRGGSVKKPGKGFGSLTMEQLKEVSAKGGRAKKVKKAE